RSREQGLPSRRESVRAARSVAARPSAKSAYDGPLDGVGSRASQCRALQCLEAPACTNGPVRRAAATSSCRRSGVLLPQPEGSSLTIAVASAATSWSYRGFLEEYATPVVRESPS